MEYSWEEIKKHNTSESCWIVANHKVYDVTSYLDKHPGSKGAILKYGGQDTTRDYNFHSSNAVKIWALFHIGYVQGHLPQDCNIL